ncbi:MAG: tRNA pseudouridine(55) synthase TruB [Isosphaeraceae bacterium]
MNATVKGILNLDKPSGITSRAVVDRVARLLPRIKVGHAGTLDPLASGVLIICVGSATRLIEAVQRMTKVYRTVIRLGARSDTLDAEGRVTVAENPSVPSELEVRQAVAGQVGEILQLPPEYSALKIKGQRAYDLARAGRVVDLQPRLVRIDRADLVSYRWPHLELEIACGGGTYIRSIARDLGEALACGGLVAALVRTRIGPFALDSSADPTTLTSSSLAANLRPTVDAVPDLPTITLNESQARAIAQGRVVDATNLALDSLTHGEIALLDADGRLIAIGQGDSSHRTIHPCKVLV